MKSHQRLLKLFSILAILAMAFSNLQPMSASAQSGDGIHRQLNAETGKVSFIGPENGRSLSTFQTLHTFARPQDPAVALVQRFAPEFGIRNPERDLVEMKSHRSDDGRMSVRYQQKYQGIPVMGGELIVNTNDNGDLYSMNGEVSPDLSLSVQPQVDAKQAQETALQSMAKWYQKDSKEFDVTQPELWIYDESLLQPSTLPTELVWRMEITPKDVSMPVQELVLVDAQRGGIRLHFNQIDTEWNTNTTPTSTPKPPQRTEPLVGTPTPLQAEPSSAEVLTGSSASLATTWYVAPTGDDSNSCTAAGSPCLTINGAIGKAAVSGDTIKVAVGIYTGSSTEVVLINKNLTLSGGWSANFTIQNDRSTIDGQAARTDMRIASGIAVTVERFRIQNGFNDNSGAGGIYVDSGNLTLNNSIVIGNVSYFGGAGIASNGTMTINNSTISGNTAGQLNYGGGGAGGGIYSLYGPVVLNNTTVSGNTILGGFNGSGIHNSGSFTLNNSTVSDNIGSVGIEHDFGTMILNNSTVTNNTGPYIGGITNSSAVVILQNSIVAGNNGTTAPDCNKATSLGHNLIGINQYTFVSGISGSLVTDTCITPTTGDLGGSTASPINPHLSILQDNGGSTFTNALIIGSPAIDAGDSATCLSTDQRGMARPVGVRCDIGAYEGALAWNPPYRVSTYTAGNSISLPGSLLCNQSDPSCALGDSHAKSAHKYAIGTYNLYSQLNRNSIDNNGMTIISTVHFDSWYDNAFWSGSQMVYGDAYGYALADDVVAHELTHGVTQYESDLLYYYQSGAINESLSDVFGEYYDQTNGFGNDAANVKWRVGEDVAGLGALRDMSNPPIYGDPDKMTSLNYDRTPYYSDYWDNGGVHTNSGVNNKAAYLMVDGDTFNGKTVTGIGWDKVGAIYYEANANLLTSGADYSDLYYALQQACSNLTGQRGITAEDCTQVKNALDAVEMNLQPINGYNTDAPVCDGNWSPTMVFADDLEIGTGNWTFTTNGAYPRWQLDSPYGQYAQSGLHSLYADDYPATVTDAKAQLRPIVIPANAYLHFAQAYDFEQDYLTGGSTLYNFDGGVLEYSTNNGSTWVDAGSLIQYNGYQGTIATSWSNPLKGRSAFVGSSHGYISTRVNLNSLAGKTLVFRWRMGLDTVGAAVGWWVDNIKLYTCTSIKISGKVGVAGATLTYTDGGPQFVMADGSGNYSITVPTGWSGTITPHKIGYSFSPASKSYTNLQDNLTGENYSASVCPSCADKDTVGVFRPSNGIIFLKNLNITGYADVGLNYGLAGDYPVVGDWNGDGIDTIGVYRNGVFLLRNSNTVGFADLMFAFGTPGDQPIAGDWDGNGIDTIGVYRPSTGQFLLRNSNSAGYPDLTFSLGNAGDVGIAGDWTGKGYDTVGVFRPSNGIIFLKNTNLTGYADVALNYGLPGDKPVVGDWDNNGTTTIGIYRMGRFYLRNSNTNGFADIIFDLGIWTDMPIAGNWDRLP